MSTIIDIGVERDHIESLTKANGITALSELIWNSLDADATQIDINYKNNGLNGFEYININDNGHGLAYSKAKEVFSKLGGSEKKLNSQSPKGRYKSLALGDLIEFRSRYQSNGSLSEFSIKIDRNQLSGTEIGNITEVKGEGITPGFTVQIQNVDFKNAETAFKLESRRELEEKFASYWISYPDFAIFFNGSKLEFSSLIKNTDQKEHKVEVGKLTYSFTIKIIEWSFENKKRTYLCNTKGIPFLETNLGIRSSLPISIFIQSVYIEKLHRDNTLSINEFDEFLTDVYKAAKAFARDYVRNQLHKHSKEFIDGLKEKGIYPYLQPAENIIEESKRHVFDIVALQINEHLPNFNEQDDQTKKLTLALISEALENDAQNLGKILTEIIELPREKRDELAELLGDTSLSCIIDTMTEIRNRLIFLNGLEQIIYQSDLNKTFKERKHLHKIIVRETWIFGDEYTYGVDDISLKNVLKAYLKDSLKREDFEEIVNSADNSALQTIPDVCLWQQYSLGNAGKENLVIELKKPRVDAGFDEKSQIESYASKVSNDPRFPKDKTRWKFILITKDVKPEIEPLLRQKHRRYGYVSEGDNFDVYILTWGEIITHAKIRHEFIKEKLSINLLDNEQGLNYLRAKYKEYLPNDF
ncbi:ATP-binding protein [Gynurincola endophyticus]|uniref:ATP-binding protein n=1 Tax=Gynurincola endophyticus TaxID=2479004 RepID=UPI000F8EF37E|nr:ATP-binding protein [Gynurincola endophyticus]